MPCLQGISDKFLENLIPPISIAAGWKVIQIAEAGVCAYFRYRQESADPNIPHRNFNTIQSGKLRV
jgi:hypothetical protein